MESLPSKTLRERLADATPEARLVLTVDLLPPASGDLGAAVDDVMRLTGLVDAVNVADMPSARLAQSSWGAAVELARRGLEPVLQVTARDRNRLALQADLMAAHALGVRNVLCLTGDHTRLGDHQEAKAVFDLSSVALLQSASGLNQGRSLAGSALVRPTDLFLGAAVNPAPASLEPQLLRAHAKVAAGARFFQTQPLFRASDAEEFLVEWERSGPAEPVLVGAFLLESAEAARFMHDRVPGVRVPEEVLDAVEATRDPASYGRDVVREVLHWATDRRRRRGSPAGVHLMSRNRFGALESLIRSS